MSLPTKRRCEIASDSETNDEGLVNPASDVLSPRKAPRYDFFADLKQRKESGRVIKIENLTLGKNFSQELKVAVSWKLRNPEKFFSFQGYDGSNFVSFKVFSKDITQFVNKIQVFQTYSIRNFSVSLVDERFRNVMSGKYEILLASDSQLETVDDMIAIPYSPITLEEVEGASADAVIDIEGILVHAEEVRVTSSNKRVREVSIIDMSKKTFPIYFWEKDAETYDLPLRVPIRFQRLQVKNYGQEKVLWFQWSSGAYTTNVDIDGKMATWFRDLTKDCDF